jgi:hypothetical protein
MSTDTQLHLANDFNRGNNVNKLAELYNESKCYFSSYYENIDESFLSGTERKDIVSSSELKRTQDVISLFNKSSVTKVDNNPDYNFQYIEREISPIRTPNGIFENNQSGKSSGTGGIDFIGVNLKKSIPIIGEIKVASDQNAFYALIQLLTYLSELTTSNQIQRINKHKLFGDIVINENSAFYLYVLFTNLSGIKTEILEIVKEIAEKLSKSLIQDIQEIVFLKLDTKSKIITNI